MLPMLGSYKYCITGFCCVGFNIMFGSIRNIKICVIFVTHNILWQASHSNTSIIFQLCIDPYITLSMSCSPSKCLPKTTFYTSPYRKWPIINQYLLSTTTHLHIVLGYFWIFRHYISLITRWYFFHWNVLTNLFANLYKLIS